MDFDLTEDQQAFAESVRRFGSAHLAENAIQRAHCVEFPWDLAEQLAKQGLLGLTIPLEDGGQGASLVEAVIAIQEIAAACPRSADLVHSGNFGPIWTFAQFASTELKNRFLPDLLAGRALMSIGMSEPNAGSALTELQTTAKADGDEYVLNGTKVFSTHSPDATIFLLYVRFGPGTDGIGSVVVERDTPGFTTGPPTEFMSGDRWSQLYFDDCRIPASNVVLGPGGFKRQISGFNVERIGNASRSLALARLAYHLAREHALSREQFGRPLCEFQGIQWKFADMAIALDSAQLLLYRAAVNAGRGSSSRYETSVAKAACNQTGFNVANESLQIMGALGYSRDTLVEYCVRRTRGWMIAGGSIEILKNAIAESVFDRRFSQRPARAANT